MRGGIELDVELESSTQERDSAYRREIVGIAAKQRLRCAQQLRYRHRGHWQLEKGENPGPTESRGGKRYKKQMFSYYQIFIIKKKQLFTESEKGMNEEAENGDTEDFDVEEPYYDSVALDQTGEYVYIDARVAATNNGNKVPIRRPPSLPDSPGTQSNYVNIDFFIQYVYNNIF